MDDDMNRAAYLRGESRFQENKLILSQPWQSSADMNSKKPRIMRLSAGKVLKAYALITGSYLVHGALGRATVSISRY